MGRVAKARTHMSFTIDPEDHAAILASGMSKTEFGREAIKHLLEHKIGHEAKLELAQRKEDEAREQFDCAVRERKEIVALQEDFEHGKLLIALRSRLFNLFYKDWVFNSISEKEEAVSLLLEKLDAGGGFAGVSDEEKRAAAEVIWEDSQVEGEEDLLSLERARR